MGTLTIASPTYAYSQAIAHGGNGWLSHAGNWEHVLADVVDNLDELRPRIAPRAREEALDRYGSGQQVADIAAALFESW